MSDTDDDFEPAVLGPGWYPTKKLLEQLREEDAEQKIIDRGVWPPTLWVGVRFIDGEYGIVSPLDWDPEYTTSAVLLIGTKKAVEWAARKSVIVAIPDQLSDRQIEFLLKSVEKREATKLLTLEDLVDESGGE